MIDPKEYERIMRSYSQGEPKCIDRRPCFARNGGKCTILWESYDDGKCPFCKKNKED